MEAKRAQAKAKEKDQTEDNWSEKETTKTTTKDGTNGLRARKQGASGMKRADTTIIITTGTHIVIMVIGLDYPVWVNMMK